MSDTSAIAYLVKALEAQTETVIKVHEVYLEEMKLSRQIQEDNLAIAKRHLEMAEERHRLEQGYQYGTNMGTTIPVRTL